MSANFEIGYYIQLFSSPLKVLISQSNMTALRALCSLLSNFLYFLEGKAWQVLPFSQPTIPFPMHT